MNLLKRIKSVVVLMFVCTLLVSATLTSCKKGDATADEETTEHPAGDSTDKADHPKGEAEHPKNESDTTKVEN